MKQLDQEREKKRDKRRKWERYREKISIGERERKKVFTAILDYDFKIE